MIEYRLLVAAEVWDVLQTLGKKDREAIRRRFEAIVNNPTAYSEFRQVDKTGRYLDVNICGRFAIVFWDDFADRDLKIIDLRKADDFVT